jgi:hypothetical protein
MDAERPKASYMPLMLVAVSGFGLNMQPRAGLGRTAVVRCERNAQGWSVIGNCVFKSCSLLLLAFMGKVMNSTRPLSLNTPRPS